MPRRVCNTLFAGNISNRWTKGLRQCRDALTQPKCASPETTLKIIGLAAADHPEHCATLEQPTRGSSACYAESSDKMVHCVLCGGGAMLRFVVSGRVPVEGTNSLTADTHKAPVSTDCDGARADELCSKSAIDKIIVRQ